MEPRPRFYDQMSPEIRQAFEEVQQDKREGRRRLPPGKEEECQSMLDLALFVFKLARLDGEYQILMTGPSVKRWVWSGHTFTDRFVTVVEHVTPRLQDRESLEELRLVATRITGAGIQRLRAALPNSKVTVYTDKDSDHDWQLTQASYTQRS